MNEKICEVCGRGYAARPSQTSGGRQICFECEVKERQFQEDYETLQKTSVLLARADDVGAEVWETEGQLLTVVDITKRQFTKVKKQDPAIYAATKKEFLMLAGAA